MLGARDRDPAVPCRPCDSGVFSKPPPTKAQVTCARTWDGTTCLTRLLCAAEGAAHVNTPGRHHRGHVGAGRDCSEPGLAPAKCGISRGGGTLRPPRAAPARPLPRVGAQRLETYGCCCERGLQPWAGLAHRSLYSPGKTQASPGTSQHQTLGFHVASVTATRGETESEGRRGALHRLPFA